MSKLTLKVKRLHPDARLPTKAHPDDAGWDLYALDDVTLRGGDTYVIRTGIAIEPPHGYYAQILGRSSLGSNGVAVLGGVIDPGYRGELKVALCNTSFDPDYPNELHFKWGDRIAQFVLLPVPEAEVVEVGELGETERQDKGFGSSGR